MDTGIQAISENCHELRTLLFGSEEMYESVPVTDAMLEHLAKGCTELREISLLRCTDITDTGLKHLAGCPRIVSIDLGNIFHITDQGMKFLASGCHDIQKILLNDALNITDDGLKFLTEGCTNIQILSLLNSNNITGLLSDVLTLTRIQIQA